MAKYLYFAVAFAVLALSILLLYLSRYVLILERFAVISAIILMLADILFMEWALLSGKLASKELVESYLGKHEPTIMRLMAFARKLISKIKLNDDARS